MRRLMLVLSVIAVVAMLLVGAAPALAQDDPAVVADAKAGGAKAEGAKAKEGTDPKNLPKSAGVTLGSSAVILPGVALLAGGGLLMYSVVRRR